MVLAKLGKVEDAGADAHALDCARDEGERRQRLHIYPTGALEEDRASSVPRPCFS